MTRARASIPARIAAALAVAFVFLLGIWVAGGRITDDFKLAMVLTAAWGVLVGLVVLAIAARRADLRYPVLGAYFVAAAAVGVYLGNSLLGDDVVHEKVATAAAPTRAEPKQTAPRRNVELARGTFEPVEHDATGVATAIRLASGGRVLTLTRFDVRTSGPSRATRAISSTRSPGGSIFAVTAPS